MIVSIIAGVSKTGVIGFENRIPWKSSEDMKFFKEKTMNHPVIMGRKTWDSLGNKPLKNRTNIVITRDRSKNNVETATDQDVIFCNHLAEAIDSCEGNTNECFIIGGTQIYSDALNMDLVDRMYINTMNFDNIVGDAFFPFIDAKLWAKQESDIKYTDFIANVYTRINHD